METDNDEYEVFCRNISNNITTKSSLKILIVLLIYFQKNIGKY